MAERDIGSTNELDRLEHSLRNLVVPPYLQRRIESYIEKKTGKSWKDPAVLERIRSAIRAQKNAYWKKGATREIRYRSGYSVLAYLAYQMPVFFAQSQHLMLLLARDGLLKEHLTILDVGSGPGVFPLALIDFFHRQGKGSATVFAIESSEEHLEAYRYLVPDYAEECGDIRVEPPIAVDLTTLTSDDLPPSVDLMVFSNVLNEIPATTEERAAILRRYASSLAGDGTLLLAEPADLANSTQLRRVALAASTGDPLTLYAPCTFLWGRRCSVETCWSFVDYGTIRPTDLMEALSQGTEGYRFHNTDVKTSYALFRKDGRTRCPFRMTRETRALPLSRLPRHVGKVVNVVAAVMSGDIGDRMYRVRRICDGTAGKSVYAVVPRYLATPRMMPLVEAEYGDILEFDEVLVRYNRSHDAFNLLITARSRVRPFSGPSLRG
jgi:SAM-dependent methyltransferase